MRTSRRAVSASAGGALCAAVLALLGACSGSDTSAVPTQAQAPYVCTGVPAEGAGLILGGAVVSSRTHGEWGLPNRGFQCDVALESGGSGLVTVEEWAIATRLGGDSESALKVLSAQSGASPIEANSDGAGFVSGTGDEGSATWVCGERMLSVDLVRVETAGRDQRADAQSLLESMLPWACDGEEAPARTAD